jgi:butyryl-CoA dehydrogenase
MDFDLTGAQKDLVDRGYRAGLELRPQCAGWDAADDAPYRLICDTMKAHGLLGLTMPAAYGGQGLTALDYVLAVESVFRGSQSWVCPEPLFCTSGPGASIILLGPETLRREYVPRIVSGELGCAIALTEPDHGSDLTSLETTAKRDGDGYVISGSKSFISGSGVNELYATFVRFDDIPGPRGIGAVLVEAELPGVDSDKGPEFVGDRGLPHGTVQFTDVHIPADHVIVGAGQFRRLMRAFNMERLHNSGLSLGLAEAAYDEAVAFVTQRKTFGRPVIEFQSVYHTLADMWTAIEGHRLLTYRAAATAAEGLYPDPLHVTLAKLSGNVMLPQITLRSMELHGGYGVTMDYAIQRLHRDAVTSVVAGGAPAVLRNSIASMLFTDQTFPQTR